MKKFNEGDIVFLVNGIYDAKSHEVCAYMLKVKILSFYCENRVCLKPIEVAYKTHAHIDFPESLLKCTMITAYINELFAPTIGEFYGDLQKVIFDALREDRGNVTCKPCKNYQPKNPYQ